MKAYPKYKPSNIEWIGEMPEHWEVKKFKFSINYLKGKNPKELVPNKLNNNFYPYLSMGYLRGNEKEIQYSEVGNNLVLINEGDLLLLWDGSNAGEFISGKEGILSSTMAIINIISDYDKKFFFYVSKAIERQLKELTKGMGIPHVETNFLNNLLLPIPSSNEQNTISHYLEDRTQKIDLLIEKKQKLIDLLKKERNATINQAITKGLNPDVPMKESGIEWLGEVPKHWEVTKLKYLTNKIGSGVTPKGGSETYLKEGIPFIRSQNVHFEGLIFDDIAYISGEVHKEMSGSKVYPNDVLLNITGASIGRCYFVPSELKEANVNQHVCIIRPNNKIITKYLFSYLSSEKGQAQIFSSEKGISREGLTFEQIGNFIITLPLIDEQELTVQFIESEYAKNYFTISRIEKEIALMQEYRTSLISEVVTGKIDVREAV